MILDMHGEKDQPHPGGGLEDLAGGSDAVQLGHGQVHHGHIGTEFSGQPDGLAAIRGLPDDIKPFPLQHPLQALADELMVICDDHSDRHLGFPWESW